MVTMKLQNKKVDTMRKQSLYLSQYSRKKFIFLCCKRQEIFFWFNYIDITLIYSQFKTRKQLETTTKLVRQKK